MVSNYWRPIGREQSDAKGDASNSNRNNQSKKKNMYVNLQLCVIMFLDVHELLDSSPFVTDTSQGI